MSFGSVISRFSDFARGLYPSSKLEGPEVPFPFQLDSIRPVVEHHLAPLIMVARSDHELLTAERDVIVDHCRMMLRHQDKLLSASEITALEDFVDRFLPNASQLEAALRTFETDKPAEFAYLIAAADRVITADDIARDEERSQLAEIKKQFDLLHGAKS